MRNNWLHIPSTSDSYNMQVNMEVLKFSIDQDFDSGILKHD